MALEPATIIEAPPGPSDAQVAARAAQTEIRVSSMPAPATATPGAKPAQPVGAKPSAAAPTKTPAMDRMRSELAKKGKDANGAVDPNAARPAVEPPKPAETEAPDPNAKPAEAALDPNAAKPAIDPKTGKPVEGKVSPWRLVDDYKTKLATAQARVQELEKSVPNPEQTKAVQERITKAEARVKELETELSYHDFATSQEFKDKFEKPYEKAWASAMSELRELTIDDGNGNARPISAQDMLSLVNMPLQKARETAIQVFGDFADDVMDQRKEIRRLFEAKNEALANGRKNGEKTLSDRAAQSQQQQAEVRTFISQEWNAANELATKDPRTAPYITPVEGDDDWNGRLQKGFALVDRAFAENPADPSLTPEQRRAIIKRHAAVRNRAAAFGGMKARLVAREARIAELEGKLKEYEVSEPGTVGRETAPASQAVQGSAMERMRAELRNRAKPA